MPRREKRSKNYDLKNIKLFMEEVIKSKEDQTKAKPDKKSSFIKLLKLFGNVIYYLLIIALVLLALITIFTKFPIPKKNYSLFVVRSGSMKPVFDTGAIVVTEAQEEYKEQDIITYRNSINKDQTITHRIIEIRKTEEDRTKYITKGDDNPSEDSPAVDPDQVIGKVIYVVPYIGYPVGYAKTPTGLIILIIVPGTIIIFSEILNIKNEWEKIKQKKKIKNSKPQNK